MIAIDQELKITRERVSYLVDLLARLRISGRPEELALYFERGHLIRVRASPHRKF